MREKVTASALDAPSDGQAMSLDAGIRGQQGDGGRVRNNAVPFEKACGTKMPIKKRENLDLLPPAFILPGDVQSVPRIDEDEGKNCFFVRFIGFEGVRMGFEHRILREGQYFRCLIIIGLTFIQLLQPKT